MIKNNTHIVQNLHNELIDILSMDERLVSEGMLVKNKVVELALNLDKQLLKYLLKVESLKRHFFSEVEDILVFDKIKFQKFVNNKQFLPDSYTSFKNKIGLTINDEFISNSKSVVLTWPYKDCVLEGGQDKEDSKRDEIFWNETLAPDQIDRLLSPKAMNNFIKYDKNGEHSKFILDKSDNLLIKGNNLLALHTLKKTHKQEVKLIYIDPPYNTGSDEFKYNDTFNESTWLTFIKNRIDVSFELLSEDGCIFISIDHHELGHLLVLMNSIFGKDNLKNIITIKRGSVTGHKTINQGVVNLSEYLVVYAKNNSKWNPNRIFAERERNERYNNFIKNRNSPISDWEFCSLLEAFSDSLDIKKSKLKKTLGNEFEQKIFEFIVENSNAVIQFAYPDESKVSNDVKQHIINSKNDPEKVIHIVRENDPDIYLVNGQRILFYSDRLIEVEGKWVTGELISDIWLDVLPNDLHNEGGVRLKKGKKPEKLIQRIIEIATNVGDTVLDFHVGSGTTAAVAIKMNRKILAVEQMNYGNNDSLVRLKNVINGDQSGISKSVNWLGGGSFVYCELAKANQVFIEKIQGSEKNEELISIWSTLQEKAFLSYRVKTKEFDSSKNEFSELSIEDQKRFLIETLDKNLLYVPLSEINDETYSFSHSDKKLNEQFFGENSI